MFTINEEDKLQIAQFCENYQVQKLELFGSATSAQFDQKNSDLDFLVEFKKINPIDLVDCYFGLKESLENKFKKRIDLIELVAIKNPYFLKEIEPQRIILYGK